MDSFRSHQIGLTPQFFSRCRENNRMPKRNTITSKANTKKNEQVQTSLAKPDFFCQNKPKKKKKKISTNISAKLEAISIKPKYRTLRANGTNQTNDRYWGWKLITMMKLLVRCATWIICAFVKIWLMRMDDMALTSSLDVTHWCVWHEMWRETLPNSKYRIVRAHCTNQILDQYRGQNPTYMKLLVRSTNWNACWHESYIGMI